MKLTLRRLLSSGRAAYRKHTGAINQAILRILLDIFL